MTFKCTGNFGVRRQPTTGAYTYYCSLQVSGIVGRADLLCAVLFLVSFLLYVKSCAYGMYGRYFYQPYIGCFGPPACFSAMFAKMEFIFFDILLAFLDDAAVPKKWDLLFKKFVPTGENCFF